MKLSVHVILFAVLCSAMAVSQEQEMKDRVYPRSAQSDTLSDEEFQRAKNIVRRSELFRGNGNGDFSFLIRVEEFKNNELENTTTLKVNVTQDLDSDVRKSLATILSGSSKGNRILQGDTSMWFYKPGTANPLRISPAQRLMGGASYSDISSTNYTTYYDPIILEDETIGKTPAHKITLAKIKFGVSYDKLIFYVARKSYRPIKGEFYTRSGRLIKSIFFRKFVRIEPFGLISTEWIIQDNLNSAKHTVLAISKMERETLPSSVYTPSGLTQ